MPRTGICLGKDKYFRLFGISKAKIADFAEIAVDIGCEDAINLDGGSSTALGYLGRSSMHESCALERSVHNVIIAVSTNVKPNL